MYNKVLHNCLSLPFSKHQIPTFSLPFQSETDVDCFTVIKPCLTLSFITLSTTEERLQNASSSFTKIFHYILFVFKDICIVHTISFTELGGK